MSMDLIISDTGQVMIASTAPFAGDVVRVDFDADTRLFSLAFADESIPDQKLDLAVNARLSTTVFQSSRVLLVALDGGRISGGYDVPLTCTGTV